VGVELGGNQSASRPRPKPGMEFEKATGGPLGQDAKEVAQVIDGVQTVELARGEQGDENGAQLGVLVGTDENPVAPTDDNGPKFALAGIVRELDTPVVEELSKGDLMAQCVPHRPTDHASVLAARGHLFFAPGKEVYPSWARA